MRRERRRVEPGPGQESVWDYPRPPACVASTKHVQVFTGDGTAVADTRGGFRVLETSHPPTWYLPRADVRVDLQRSDVGSTWCEWKGPATYWDLPGGLRAAGWSYEDPAPGFAAITGFLAFDPRRLDCRVDGERARPQEGGFYAGWITDDVVGPFKGGPGTLGW